METPRRQVVEWLFPRARRNVLALLLMDSQRRWHLRDVVRRTSCAIGTVRRELAGLTACGILIATRDGNRMYYQANVDCPVYPELVGMIRKTSGLADVLRSAMEELGSRVQIAFIYGSQARGDARSDSDIDVMVIGEPGFGEVVAALAKAQDSLGREVNPTVYSPEEFREKASAGHHFIRSVMREPKVFLIGDANELGQLAQ